MKYKTNEIHICLKVNIVYVVCLENIFIVSTVLYFLLNEAKYKAVICFSAYSCMYFSFHFLLLDPSKCYVSCRCEGLESADTLMETCGGVSYLKHGQEFYTVKPQIFAFTP